MDLFIQFHFEINHYATRFGHLFQYDFSQAEFQLLKDNSQILREYFQSVMTEELESSKRFSDYPDQDMIEYLVVLHSFFDNLKMELK